jgi:hypothetical protein
MIGKIFWPFSNHWKKFSRFFQRLEKKFPMVGKFRPIFPMIGKLFSNGWKTFPRPRGVPDGGSGLKTQGAWLHLPPSERGVARPAKGCERGSKGLYKGPRQGEYCGWPLRKAGVGDAGNAQYSPRR